MTIRRIFLIKLVGIPTELLIKMSDVEKTDNKIDVTVQQQDNILEYRLPSGFEHIVVSLSLSLTLL